MRLSDDVYEYIKQEVTDLFVRYDIRRIPISGDELAKKDWYDVDSLFGIKQNKVERRQEGQPRRLLHGAGGWQGAYLL